MKNGRSKYFNHSEQQLIKACDAFNKAVSFNPKNKRKIKIVTGDTIILIVQNRHDTRDSLSFELDEKHFTGLMHKYKSHAEIREMLISLFSDRKNND